MCKWKIEYLEHNTSKFSKQPGLTRSETVKLLLHLKTMKVIRRNHFYIILQ